MLLKERQLPEFKIYIHTWTSRLITALLANMSWVMMGYSYLGKKHQWLKNTYKCYDICEGTLKPGSQYIARDAVRPEVITFSMGFAASRR